MLSGGIDRMVASAGACSTGTMPWHCVQWLANRVTPVLSDSRCCAGGLFAAAAWLAGGCATAGKTAAAKITAGAETSALQKRFICCIMRKANCIVMQLIIDPRKRRQSNSLAVGGCLAIRPLFQPGFDMPL